MPEPMTVTLRGFGDSTASGTYSLTLREALFAVDFFNRSSGRCDCSLGAAFPADAGERPGYCFRFGGDARLETCEYSSRSSAAGEMDVPAELLLARARSGRRVGELEATMIGEGSGVMSPRADSCGDDTIEPGEFTWEEYSDAKVVRMLGAGCRGIDAVDNLSCDRSVCSCRLALRASVSWS